jgi:D-xylose transport system substrate-binding protein
MRTKSLTLLAATVGVSLVLAGCGANSSPSSGSSASAPAPAPAGAGALGKVGVILPETATSARWEGFDKPMLQKALTDAGFSPDIQNAQGDVQKFSTLADGMIAQGVKVLIIAAINSEVGSAVAAVAPTTTCRSTTKRSAPSRARVSRPR